MHRPFLLLALAAAVLAEEPAPAPKPPANPIAAIKTSKGEIQVRLFADETPKTVENFLGLAEGTKEFRDVKTEQMVKRPFYDGLIFHRVIKDFMIQSGCPNGDGTGDPGYRFEDEINADAFGFDKLKVLVDGRPSHPCLQIRSQEEFQANILMPIVRKMGIDSDEALQARSAEVSKKLQETVPNLTVKEALENLGYVYAAGHPSHEPKKGCLAMANSGPNTNGSQFFITLADAPWLTGRHTVFGEVIKGMDVVETIGSVTTGPEDLPAEEIKILSIRRLAAEELSPPAPAGK